MGDPITPHDPTDALSETARPRENLNTDRRHWWHNRTHVSDADLTVDVDDECVRGSATTAARAWTLPAGIDGETHWLYATAADGVNTITVTPDGAETIGGAASQVMDANDENMLICYVEEDTNWEIRVDNR